MAESTPGQASDAAPAALPVLTQLSGPAPVTATPAAEPAPAAAPVTTPAAPVTPAAPASPATLTNVDDIDAALEANYLKNPNEKVIIEGLDPTPAPVPVQAPAPAQVTQPPAPVTEAAAAADTGRIIPAKIPTGQFSTIEQRAMALSHTLNDGKTPEDPGYVPLEQCLALTKAAHATTAPATVQSEPVAPPPDPVAPRIEAVNAAQSNIDSILEQLAEFKKNPDTFADEIDASKDALTDAKIVLAKAQWDKDAAEAQVAQHAASRDGQAQQRALLNAQARFPSLEDKTSDLRMLANAMILERRNNPQHPEHALTLVPTAPSLFADMAARELAQSRATKNGTEFGLEYAKLLAAPVAAKPATPETAPVQPAKILPSPGSSGTPVTVAPTMEQQLAAIGDDPAKAEALLSKGLEGQFFLR